GRHSSPCLPTNRSTAEHPLGIASYNSHVPIWARLITAVAALRVSTALVLYLGGHSPLTALPLPAWAYAAFAFVFTAVGSLLVIGSRRDPRAAWLGGVFLLLTTPVTPTVLAAFPLTAWLVFVR